MVEEKKPGNETLVNPTAKRFVTTSIRACPYCLGQSKNSENFLQQVESDHIKIREDTDMFIKLVYPSLLLQKHPLQRAASRGLTKLERNYPARHCMRAREARRETEDAE